MAKVGPFMLKHSHLSHDKFVSQIFYLPLPSFVFLTPAHIQVLTLNIF